jgi:predicted ArsR family transcriptional regulator
VLRELRHRPATIRELTERLLLSSNAVRSHLAALERDGLVALEQAQRKGVGKPAYLYRLTADAHSLTPKAYDAMLDVVLNATRDASGAKGYAVILKSAAERLAGSHEPVGTLKKRLNDTKMFLAKVGADVQVERRGDKLRLTGTDCPLASIVAAHPELCRVLADVIARRLGVPVNDCCDRSTAMPRCCFEALVGRVA